MVAEAAKHAPLDGFPDTAMAISRRRPAGVALCVSLAHDAMREVAGRGVAVARLGDRIPERKRLGVPVAAGG